ncbi:toll/interleukin-1 receptor domain-containing protein [Hydrogenophaga sp.]|uniref:toll/interleukin-1 receptor domain-containing protein n=1 Tax=Hydrogenophaga sp. TaxID=1904254 RepID=UPI002FCCAC95
MSDVFLSYASEDRERAGRVAKALGRMGWSVWWDREIIAGQAFDQVIERALDNARCVVVLWSVNSVASEWVKNEAAAASERGVLVPALMDNVKLPLEFRRKQAADLLGWQGNELHPGFQALCQGVAHALRSAAPSPRSRRVVQPAASRPRWVVPGVAMLALVLGLGLYAVGSWRVPPAITPAPVTAAPAPAREAVAVPPPTVQSPVANPPATASAPAAADAPGLADLVVGTYSGDVIADSQGPSRSDVEVTITRIDRATVRVSSDYRRIEAVEVNLTRNGNQIFAADGSTPFIVDLDRSPPTLVFDPRSELAYRGTRRP